MSAASWIDLTGLESDITLIDLEWLNLTRGLHGSPSLEIVFSPKQEGAPRDCTAKITYAPGFGPLLLRQLREQIYGLLSERLVGHPQLMLRSS